MVLLQGCHTSNVFILTKFEPSAQVPNQVDRSYKKLVTKIFFWKHWDVQVSNQLRRRWRPRKSKFSISGLRSNVGKFPRFWGFWYLSTHFMFHASKSWFVRKSRMSNINKALVSALLVKVSSKESWRTIENFSGWYLRILSSYIGRYNIGLEFL